MYFGYPSRTLKVIGVTGTDGKTTTTHLINDILKKAGKKTVMISSISAPGLHTTTPRPFELQKIFKNAITQQAEYVVLETTSHALDQFRVWGIDYEVSVITNITREHLDYHKVYEDYVSTKVKLLKLSKIKIVNHDDESFDVITKFIESAKLITYGLTRESDYGWQPTFSSKIKGQYNKLNILAAYAVCHKLGLNDKTIISAINDFILPTGRLDVIYKRDFKVIIDFAHTPNAIYNVLTAVKHEFQLQGRIIHVFGSAGLRDFSKRQAMGKASGQFADRVILTEEDYRTEKLEKICREIGSGLSELGFKQVEPADLQKASNKSFCILSDRSEAIRAAIEMAKPGDIVIMTGKSHEKSLARGTKEYPWDEYNAVRMALKQFSKD